MTQTKRELIIANMKLQTENARQAKRIRELEEMSRGAFDDGWYARLNHEIATIRKFQTVQGVSS